MTAGSPTALDKSLDLPRRQLASGGVREPPTLPGDDLSVFG
ncbi:hypothetical protein ACFQ7M_20205 [Streptomyces massasporeus]